MINNLTTCSFNLSIMFPPNSEPTSFPTKNKEVSNEAIVVLSHTSPNCKINTTNLFVKSINSVNILN